MSKLNELINSLQNDEQIIRFKELEKIIDHNESIKNDFEKMLSLQKTMVQKEFKKSKDLDQAKAKYQKQRNHLMKYPIIDEYLDLLDAINSDLNMIKTIIEQEIDIDFD